MLQEKDEQHLSIVEEYMEGGSLYELVQQFGQLPETLVKVCHY
jgi:serine/threonine protein kinase